MNGKKIPVRHKHTLVDADDFEYLSQFTWGLHSQGYAIRSVPKGNGRKIFLHREVMRAKKDQRVDHINGDVLDNRKANLRFCNNTENSRNRKKSINNTTGHKGVSFEQGLWRARIWVDGKPKHLGNYKDKESAARAYDDGAIKYFGEFARLNFAE